MRKITVSRGRIQCSRVESVCDQGFKRRAYKLLSKKEDTWCKILWYYDTELDSALRSRNPIIQRGEASRGSGMGGILHISDGNPNLLGANRNDDGQWLNAYYGKPDNRWNRDNGFAFAVSQLSLFLSHFLREFSFSKFFNNFPRHPPRFLPISSNFADKAMYFLLSKDFVSQSIIKNTFKVSSFLIAKRTNGSFSFSDRKFAVIIASIASIKILSIFSPKEYLCVFGIIW